MNPQVPTVGRESVQVMTPNPAIAWIAAGTAWSLLLIDPD